MYHWVCHTCEEEDVIRTLDTAQEHFNEHAQKRHEVELLKLDVDAEHPDETFDSDDSASRTPEQSAEE